MPKYCEFVMIDLKVACSFVPFYLILLCLFKGQIIDNRKMKVLIVDNTT